MRFFYKTFFILSLLLSASRLYALTTLISPTAEGGFELGNTFTANGWTLVNGASGNRWWVGTGATPYAGSYCSYVSNNATGSSNNYNNGAVVVHFYRDITFPAGESNITLTFQWKCEGESTFDYMKVFLISTSTTPTTGSEPSSGQVGTIYNVQSGSWQTATITLPCSAAGTTQRLVFSWKNDNSGSYPPATAVDNISLTSDAGTPSCTTLLGTGVINVSSLPYSSGSGTTQNAVDDLTSSIMPTCGNTNYTTGEDQVFIFTPATSGQITISLTSTGSYTGLMLYDACPVTCSGVTANCVVYAQSSTGNKSMCTAVTGGTTYYLVLDSWTSPSYNAYSNLSISDPVVSPACSSLLGTGVTTVASLPYSSGAGTTCGSVNDLTSATSISCGTTAYMNGQDKVWEFTPSTSGPITVSVTSTGTNGSLLLYQGCPVNSCSIAGGTCVTYAQSTTGSQSVCASVTAGVTYYAVYDTKTSPGCNAYSNFTITATGAGVANDLPCNAVSLTLGSTVSGNNLCADNTTGEPSSPSCWSSGTLNTVWYSVVCPSSQQLRIITTLGTLSNTQIALYSGSCSSLTYVACNDNIASCGSGFTSFNSELYVTSGLVAGNTYYISVDGSNSNAGTFDIVAMDGSQPVSSAAGRECSSPTPVCTSSISVSNPGYQSYGNICDFGGTAGNCLTTGEVNAVWYEIVINGTGSLEFDIVPNDYPGNANGNDYDFAVWKTAGSGAVSCSQISGGTVNPFRCNYSFLGVTGLYSFGQAPPSYSGFDASYEQNIGVVSGDKYLLVVSNYAGSTQGFTLNFSAASPIDYSTPSQVIWTGTTNTTWNVSTNWGSCTYPTCMIDAVISSATNQPTLISGTVDAKSVTVNSGATLTLQSGAVLNICGDFVNYGTISANANSTINFVGTGTQNIWGTMSGTSKLGNVVVNKSSGSVVLNTTLEVGGDFTTSNSTSIFNIGGQYMKVAGHFNNSSGSTTFTGVTGSTLEFEGSSNQNYNPGGSLTLYDVKMNQSTASTVTLSNNNMTLSGTLTLTNGRISTGSYEVSVTNTATSAASSGSVNSYVDGYLRRATTTTGSYDFPVGDYASGKGYQRANINFTLANTATDLLAKFDSYSSVPAALNSSECGVNYNLPALDNGYWTISSTPSTSTGTYTMTLYNTSGTYTNGSGATSWTVMKKPSSGIWGLDGTCSVSTINQVVRVGMTGFSSFGTAQSSLVLPIQLVTFSGHAVDYGNLLEWTTAAEFNNDYFVVERSADGNIFFELGRVDGAGNSPIMHHYQFTDGFPVNGENYYRLRQTDFNGDYAYSNVVTIENLHPMPVIGTISPNPTTGPLLINLITAHGGTVQFELVDLFGSVAYRELKEITNDHPDVHIDFTNVTRGVYFLKCSLAEYGYVSVNKIVLQ